MPEVKIIADLRECEQSRVAVLENGRLAEIFIDYNLDDENTFIPSRFKTRPGDIFKARVDKILPAINAAFCALSKRSNHKDSSRNAFIYLNEISDNPDNIKPGHEIIVQVIKISGKNKAPLSQHPNITPRQVSRSSSRQRRVRSLTPDRRYFTEKEAQENS